MLGFPRGHFHCSHELTFKKDPGSTAREGRQGQQQYGKPKTHFGGTVNFYLTDLRSWEPGGKNGNQGKGGRAGVWLVFSLEF